MIDRTEQDIMKNWKGDENTPLVSVCTITYKHEKFIAEALDSFLMQETDFPFELVVDDDCSPDGTADVIRQYIEKFPNIIKANLREKNVGMMPNFIANMQRAKGKYIALCEADDYWTDPLKLQKQYEALHRYQECDLCFHSSIIEDMASGWKSDERWNYGENEKIFTVVDIIENTGQFAPTGSYFFRRKVVDNLPQWFYDAPIGDFFIEVFGAQNGGCLYLPYSMSVYRVGHAESWTQNIHRRYTKSQFDHIKKMDVSFKFLDEYLEKKFELLINNRRAMLRYTQAEYALYTFDKDLFMTIIEGAYNISDKTNSQINTLFHYRKWFYILVIVPRVKMLWYGIKEQIKKIIK